MNTLTIDRRQLIKMGLSAGVLAALPFGCIELDDDDAGRLLEFVSDSDLPVDEKRTGTLSHEDFDTLSTLCRYVDRVWELGANLDDYLQQLRVDLGFKTEEEPSYLTEYENAIELIQLLVRGSDSVEQAWASLLFSELEGDNFSHTRLGRARKFVFSEIITHQIPISGGFKSFGLWNYTGYFGGAYTSPTSYRRGNR
jgi:hypothetical protein